jgi:hypothetical protein
MPMSLKDRSDPYMYEIGWQLPRNAFKAIFSVRAIEYAAPALMSVIAG